MKKIKYYLRYISYILIVIASITIISSNYYKNSEKNKEETKYKTIKTEYCPKTVFPFSG